MATSLMSGILLSAFVAVEFTWCEMRCWSFFVEQSSLLITCNTRICVMLRHFNSQNFWPVFNGGHTGHRIWPQNWNFEGGSWRSDQGCHCCIRWVFIHMGTYDIDHPPWWATLSPYLLIVCYKWLGRMPIQASGNGIIHKKVMILLFLYVANPLHRQNSSSSVFGPINNQMDFTRKSICISAWSCTANGPDEEEDRLYFRGKSLHAIYYQCLLSLLKESDSCHWNWWLSTVCYWSVRQVLTVFDFSV